MEKSSSPALAQVLSAIDRGKHEYRGSASRTGFTAACRLHRVTVAHVADLRCFVGYPAGVWNAASEDNEDPFDHHAGRRVHGSRRRSGKAQEVGGELVIRCTECDAVNVAPIAFSVLGLL